MEILNAVKNNKFVYFGFDPRAENKNDPWNALPNLSTSSEEKAGAVLLIYWSSSI